MLLGGEILNSPWIQRQTHLAIWQSKNRWWIDSFNIHATHCRQPFQCFFTKLSVVRAILFIRYHIKILILRGILIFQMGWFLGTTCGLLRALHIDHTVNFPCRCKDQIKISLWSFSWVMVIKAVSCCQPLDYYPPRIDERLHLLYLILK
jgi:hypothetical protein